MKGVRGEVAGWMDGFVNGGAGEFSSRIEVMKLILYLLSETSGVFITIFM